ncbi:NAD(P)H-dependent oxidoreductase [Flammeovirga yaeyamensis]|uniref:NAD(P)H-dependent oxidoreductase n=1 Tax=Flammeovirga yaeyamensis TaxID=367791 RepID=A0AAX1MZK8_9BACT|nr:MULTISPECIES: NAD(P)H-dependent oxidoreductase [Flammeovirga]ANQ47818.1 NAD(P)H-dependent oxidoreductase [Flammeovirga sp. MY04]MBB3700286.1 nitroreductase [Flammeovirga yaeyamensis]NMF37088.1 NAD(P)H-dependent oxidoreductase [Flammeovirga yaeyamensis]QWG00779.1 NAD(P)H-dependent oxidoreductase [Flammeovirga yaeyamensis]
MSIIESLNWRYATKKFDPTKKLDEATVNTILEAGNLSASSYGLQPWKIIVVKNEEIRQQLVEHSWGQQQVVDASHLLVIARHSAIAESDVQAFIENISETRGIPQEALAEYKGMMTNTVNNLSDQDKDVWVGKQAYIVLGNLLAVCAELKVDSTPMEGFVPDKYDEILGLDKLGLKSTVLLPIGFRAEDDDYQQLKKVRKSLSDSVLYI